MDLGTIDLTDLDRFANGFPHDMFAVLRREVPVWFHPATEHTPDGEGFWVLSRHADCDSAGGDAATFSSHHGGGRSGGGTVLEDLPDGLVAGVVFNMMDDPRHHRIRRAALPCVAPRAIGDMEATLRERAVAIVDAAVALGDCDLLVDVAAELPLQAIAASLGVPQEDRHFLFEWANVTLDYDDRELGETSEAMLAASAQLMTYATALIGERSRCPTDDMLSAVVHATIDGAAGATTLAEQQLFFILLSAAGSETTRNSIALGVQALVERPEQWRALQADRSLLATATEEILRWATSAPYNRRTATRDVEVGGQQIRAGDKVTLWWASANRDELVFDRPDEFDITRAPNPHLAFGHGTHHCLGANLARLEIRLMLDVLLDRVASIELTGPVEHARSNKHTGVRHMPVRLTSLG